MLTSSIIDVIIFSNSSLNEIISLGPIPCFRLVNRILYIWKVIIAKTSMSEWSLSRNGSHKLSKNYNLHAFFRLTVTKKKKLLNFESNSHSFVYIYITFFYFSSIILNNVFIWFWNDNNFLSVRKFGSYLESLILILIDLKFWIIFRTLIT